MSHIDVLCDWCDYVQVMPVSHIVVLCDWCNYVQVMPVSHIDVLCDWCDYVQVMPVSHIDVMREEAYMLFYVRHPKLTVRTVLFSVKYDMIIPPSSCLVVLA